MASFRWLALARDSMGEMGSGRAARWRAPVARSPGSRGPGPKRGERLRFGRWTVEGERALELEAESGCESGERECSSKLEGWHLFGLAIASSGRVAMAGGSAHAEWEQLARTRKLTASGKERERRRIPNGGSARIGRAIWLSARGRIIAIVASAASIYCARRPNCSLVLVAGEQPEPAEWQQTSASLLADSRCRRRLGPLDRARSSQRAAIPRARDSALALSPEPLVACVAAARFLVDKRRRTSPRAGTRTRQVRRRLLARRLFAAGKQARCLREMRAAASSVWLGPEPADARGGASERQSKCES